MVWVVSLLMGVVTVFISLSTSMSYSTIFCSSSVNIACPCLCDPSVFFPLLMQSRWQAAVLHTVPCHHGMCCYNKW